MSTGVFANDLEIACKASDGKSPASFPDPCWSPPAPSAGWLMIPYANTAYAKHATKTSKTVFIGGKPVMLKDKSYYKTSTGNEAAAGPKGKSTGTKKGKAYFRSWSMDIKVEGYNVCRHTDMMTQNHNPVQGNTGSWHFLSEDTKNKCNKEIKNIDKECEVDKREQKKFVGRQVKRNKKRLKHKPPKSKIGVRPKTWKDNHCKSLLFKPDPKNLMKKLDKLETDAKSLYEDMAGEAWDAVGGRIVDKGIDYGVRTGAKHGAALGCLALSPVGEAACQAIVVVTDVVDAAISIVSLPFNIYGAYTSVSDVTKLLKDIPETIDKIKDVIGDKAKLKEMRDELTEDARAAANKDDCIQARKCLLVPFDKNCQETLKHKAVNGTAVKEKKSGGDFMTQMGMGYSGGCCPGQTGHHLIPGSWAEGSCSGYVNNKNHKSHQCAPVACVEGITQNDGTHKSIHYNLNKALEKAGGDGDYPQDKVMDMAVDSHQKTFPKTGDCTVCRKEICRKECLKAQLEDYYKCGDFNVKKIPQKGEAKPDIGDDSE